MKKELGPTGLDEKNKSLTLQEIYYLRYVENENIAEISKRICVSTKCVYKYLANFEKVNPIEAERMKKQGKDLAPEDYRELLRENATLKKQLSRESLRPDFYEEMVKYAKEMYGIDLKKAGAK